MRTSLFGRALGAAMLLVAAACSDTSNTPTGIGEEDVALSAIGVDPSLAAMPGQASLPGLTLDMHAFFPRFGSPIFGDLSDCAWSPDVERFVCDAVVRNGLTFTRSFALYDADGNSQQQRDENTRSVDRQVGVTGTVTREKGSVTIDRSSDLTVSGLGRESTQHTLNGAEVGTTVATRTTDQGTLTVTEQSGDTVTNVVVHAPRARDNWPLSGTAVHAAKATVEATGKPTKTYTRREVVTFNGTRLVPVVITRNGLTRECTRDLGTGRVRCD